MTYFSVQCVSCNVFGTTRERWLLATCLSFIPGAISCLTPLPFSITKPLEYKMLDKFTLCLYIHFNGFQIPILNTMHI